MPLYLRTHVLYVLFACLFGPGASLASQVTEEELTKGPWQFGLVGDARSMPIGLAFKTGVTAAVVTLLPDGKARIQVPCRNDEFIEKIGENLVYTGSWNLTNDRLSLSVSFRGHVQTEAGRVEIHGEEMSLFQRNGVVRRLGRFLSDVNAPCRYD